jgi:RTA1 like protein
MSSNQPYYTRQNISLADPSFVCTGQTCDINLSHYGYYPNLGVNAFFLALYLLTTLTFLVQGVYYRTWSFTIAMGLGGLCEVVGTGGRIMLHNNPFSDPGFKVQIVLLTFAPAFLAAGVYFTLKHLVIVFGANFSRIKPQAYTYIFISCDLLSLVLQGAGGGLASAANDNKSLLDAGNNLMIAGLAFQVFTLLIFAGFAGEYFLRALGSHSHELNPATASLRHSLKFRMFLVALGSAYFAILIRCIYRVAEMAGGWGNKIMQNQPAFEVCDAL